MQVGWVEAGDSTIDVGETPVMRPATSIEGLRPPGSKAKVRLYENDEKMG